MAVQVLSAIGPGSSQPTGSDSMRVWYTRSEVAAVMVSREGLLVVLYPFLLKLCFVIL